MLHAVGQSAEHHGGMRQRSLETSCYNRFTLECEDTWRPLRVTSGVDKIVTNRYVVSRSPGGSASYLVRLLCEPVLGVDWWPGRH